MTRLEDPRTIESKVGARRHRYLHLARAVDVTERVYLLHSHLCVESGIDLRACEYSIALDRGIDDKLWGDMMNRPVIAELTARGDLAPYLYVGALREKLGAWLVRRRELVGEQWHTDRRAAALLDGSPLSNHADNAALRSRRRLQLWDTLLDWWVKL